jgi:hypothetical protein
MHGGALGSGAPIGNQNAVKSKLYRKQASEEWGQSRELMRAARRFVRDMTGG